MQNHHSLIYREEEREMMPTLKVRFGFPTLLCGENVSRFQIMSISTSALLQSLGHRLLEVCWDAPGTELRQKGLKQMRELSVTVCKHI